MNIKIKFKENARSIIFYCLVLCSLLMFMVYSRVSEKDDLRFILRSSKNIPEEIRESHVRLHRIKEDEIVLANAYFNIKAYKGDKNSYNFRRYLEAKPKIEYFLDISCVFFKDGDIVSVDGLKFKINVFSNSCGKVVHSWEPFPNPPKPVLESRDSNEVREHIIRYARWINEHPHFGYPPIPINEFDQ